MTRTKATPNKKAAPKRIAVIKNGHTDAELDEMEERWANHQGPYMTLAETLAHAAQRAKQPGNRIFGQPEAIVPIRESRGGEERSQGTEANTDTETSYDIARQTTSKTNHLNGAADDSFERPSDRL